MVESVAIAAVADTPDEDVAAVVAAVNATAQHNKRRQTNLMTSQASLAE